MLQLLTSKNFAPLFWCQFFSAFNDNLLKNGLIALIVFGSSGSGGGGLVQIAGAVFILPFFILSALGGEIADRYDKAMIARRLKFAEIFVALLAATGFMMHSVPVLMISLGLFGIIAALFGPIKYGILPDHLKTEALPNANALIEAATFIAILAATIIGTKIGANDPQGYGLAALISIMTLLCWFSSRHIPSTDEGAADLQVNPNILASTHHTIEDLRLQKQSWHATLAVSWFWLVGAVSLALLATLVKTRFGGTEDVFIASILIFTLGIGFGSMLAARIAHGRINLRPATYGLAAMGFFALDLGLTSLGVSANAAASASSFFMSLSGAHFIIDLFGLAAASGLFIVPVFAGLQSWAGADQRARVIAANNIINALFIVAGALASAALQSAAGISEPLQFMVLGGLCLIFVPLFWRFVVNGN